VPTYQYACTACGEPTEVVQSFTDAALTECPACTGALRKVYSAVGVVFKGSGFYKNDSRSTTGNGDSKGESDSKSKNDSKSDSKSDSPSKTDTAAASSKPAAKTDKAASTKTTPASTSA